MDETKNNANRPIDLIPMPSALLSCLQLPLRGQEPRQKQVGIGHRGRYNDYRASVDIRTLNITVGSLPAKVRGLVQEWAELHKDELLDMWNSKDFHKIAPLV